MIVVKFGGSSLATAGSIRRAADQIAAGPCCVVLSAMGRTTDDLFAAARAAEHGDSDSALALVRRRFDGARIVAAELLRDAVDTIAVLTALELDLDELIRGIAQLRQHSARATDAVVAHGERMSTAVFAALLRERGREVERVDARDFMRTDDRFGAASPDRDALAALAVQRLGPALARGAVVVTEGYVGSTASGATTTLGRGGSDWSAALVGAALRATEVQIWTDVEGVLTADPRVVPDAVPIGLLSAGEAAELAAFGAKVLHPSTIQPAVDARIPVTVRHTLRPDGAFTTIDPRRGCSGRGAVVALAGRGPVTVLTMTSRRMLAASGYLAKLFAVFGELGVCVDLIATAEVSVACTVEPDAPVDRLVQALEGLAHVEVAPLRAIVAAVGDGLRRAPRVLERASRALHPIAPEMVCFGGNDRNLSFVVRDSELAAAMQRLHAEFFGATAAIAAAGRAEAAP